MFEIGFLRPSSGKEMEKIGFGAQKKWTPSKTFFKLELFASTFFSIFNWLLMLAMLITESCL